MHLYLSNTFLNATYTTEDGIALYKVVSPFKLVGRSCVVHKAVVGHDLAQASSAAPPSPSTNPIPSSSINGENNSAASLDSDNESDGEYNDNDAGSHQSSEPHPDTYTPIAHICWKALAMNSTLKFAGREAPRHEWFRQGTWGTNGNFK